MNETPSVKIDEQPVKVQMEESQTRLVKTDDHLSKAPDTTSEEDLHSKSQRKVNLIWEYSQASIALVTVFTTCLGIFIGRVWVGLDSPIYVYELLVGINGLVSTEAITLWRVGLFQSR
ncbi:MAG TPA: hypothetical protein VK619_10345 [Pyrinomonadaceae bacterium]|nr:hypothetical protein [Pyrinomonadaceae bacterium]